MSNKKDQISKILYNRGYYEFYSEDNKLIMSFPESVATDLVNLYFETNFLYGDPEDAIERATKRIEKLRNLKFTIKEYEEQVYVFLPAANIEILEAEKLVNACGEFMEALGYELVTEDEPIYGSFIQQIWFKLKKGSLKTKEEIVDDFGKGKKALELKYVELPTAEQTEKLANSAAKIVKLLEKQPEGIVRLGALLVLKKKVNGESKIFIHQLSYEMIKTFDESPALLQDLQRVYEIITGKAGKIEVKVIGNSKPEELNPPTL